MFINFEKKDAKRLLADWQKIIEQGPDKITVFYDKADKVQICKTPESAFLPQFVQNYLIKAGFYK